MSNSSTSITSSDKVKKTARKPSGYLDDKYIELYCDNPKQGKTATLIAAGYEGDYANQEANRIHKRLQDRIKQRLTEKINELDALSYNNLKTILEEHPDKVGYSNALAAIRQGMEYAGRKPGDTLTIKKDEPIDDIEQRIKANRDKITRLTGKS